MTRKQVIICRLIRLIDSFQDTKRVSAWSISGKRGEEEGQDVGMNIERALVVGFAALFCICAITILYLMIVADIFAKDTSFVACGSIFMICLVMLGALDVSVSIKK